MLTNYNVVNTVFHFLHIAFYSRVFLSKLLISANFRKSDKVLMFQHYSIQYGSN